MDTLVLEWCSYDEAVLCPLLADQYGPANVVLLNSVLGPTEGGSGWHFWFIEALVYILIAAAALVSAPAVDRFERRHPFGLPVAVLAIGLLTRYDLVGLDALSRVPSALVVFWLFALGWAAAKEEVLRQGHRGLHQVRTGQPGAVGHVPHPRSSPPPPPGRHHQPRILD